MHYTQKRLKNEVGRGKFEQATNSLVILLEILVEEGHVPRKSNLSGSLEELVDESVHLGHHVVADVFTADLRGNMTTGHLGL